MSLHQAAQTPQSQPQAVRRRRTRPSRLQAQANAGAGPTKKYKIPTIDAERARMYEPTFAGTGACVRAGGRHGCLKPAGF